jgi:hypothetical protein
MTKKEEQALLIFERKIFRKIYGPKYEDGEWKSRTNQELEDLSKGENIVKWIKGQRISWLGHLEKMVEDRMPKKHLHSRTGRDETKWRTQERMERRSRERSSGAGSEKMERDGDRWDKMERYCSTFQSPQRAVAPTEEEDVLVAPATLRRRTVRDLEDLIMARSLGRTVEYVSLPIQTVRRTEDSQNPLENIKLSFILIRYRKVPTKTN